MSKYDNDDADDDTTSPATVFVFDCDRYYQTNNLLLWTFRSFSKKRHAKTTMMIIIAKKKTHRYYINLITPNDDDDDPP